MSNLRRRGWWKKRLQYFEFGLQYLVQPLGVNPTYSTFNQTTKDKDKITHCSSQKVFCSFNKKQRKFNSYSEDYAVLFCIWLFNFYSRLLTEYFRFA